MTDSAVLPSRGDPLVDTLFRPTVEVVPLAAASAAPSGSAAPVRASGTRVRAGNAMARTRAALLDGAVRAIAVHGTAITMAEVALTAGVAKATLYNHFRTREAVLSAVALAQVHALMGAVVELPLRQSLIELAAAVSTHPALTTLREREPAVLAAAAAASQAPPAAVAAARAGLTDLLANAGFVGSPVAADVLLRWLISLALTPAAPADVLTTVDLLIAGISATHTAD